MYQPILMRSLWLPLTIFVLFMAAISFRPLLPIDETRYMSVAWEMFLRQGWLQPLTMNFQPYHHKPPLLFWLINSSWAVFGVSRWAGLVPIVLASMTSVWLTGVLGRLLLPDYIKDGYRTGLIMAASVPFLIYSTLVLFDLTLTVCVLSSLIGIVLYSRSGLWRYAIMVGVCMGLGVLTKGPVAYLYTLFPFLLGPIWQKGALSPGKWYAGMLTALAVSVVPVLFWLVPVLRQADGDFAFWLVWEQTAGRVTGNFGDAHVRPVYFYLPLLPIMLMPWIFFPSFWAGIKSVRAHIWKYEGTRFVLCWIIPTFFCFCLISGKQPHYLVPLLPGMMLLTTIFFKNMGTKILEKTLVLMLALIVVGQAVASQTAMKAYDLAPIASYVRAHPDQDWAYVRNYHAEVGFLARLQKPVTDRQPEEIDEWFATHPQGFAIIRYKNPEDVADYRMLFDGPYRGKRMGIFSSKTTAQESSQ